jgi:hypothetical protein
MSNARKVRIIEVTPALAERWLKLNTHNRPIKERLIAQYAATMKRGEWRLTPEPIAFTKPWKDPADLTDHKETLIEGQHRLHAVLRSGVSVPMTVWFGCEPEEFQVIGQGAERTNGDVLSIVRKDLDDPVGVAQTAMAFIRNALSDNRAVDQWMVRKVMDHLEPDLIEVTKIRRMLKRIARREFAAAMLLGHMVNPAQIGFLAKQLKDAVGFKEMDPARALYSYLNEYQIGARKDSQDVYFYKVCQAVMHELSGGHIRQLKVTTEGLAWLRNAARPKLDLVLRDLYGRVPNNFYEPKLSPLSEVRYASEIAHGAAAGS